MKTFLLIITALLLAPAFAFAANDVTLTTSTILSVGGYTLNISGSSAVINSITVNTSNFSVTLSSGSSIKITAAGRNQLGNNVSSDVVASVCDDTTSSLELAYSGGGTVTNIITPSATLCSGTASPSPSPSPSPTSSAAPISSSGSSGGSFVSFPGVSPVAVPVSFTRDLEVGSVGADVKNLQIFLNSNGFLIAATGPGSRGQETTTFGGLTKIALMKFQKSRGVAATGFFGPITRASVNGASTQTVAPITKPIVFTRDLSLGSENDEVLKLQILLAEAGFLKATPTGYFGAQTRAAVKAFQKSRGITQTGTVGPLTRAALSK